MSQEADSVPDRLVRAFAPPTGGVPGLVEQLLRACAGANVAFERVGNRCVCRWTESDTEHERPIPVPPQAFRSLLAQIAARCNEHLPESVSPYGGAGKLLVGGDEVAVSFVNTAESQKLELTSGPQGTSAERAARVEPPVLGGTR